MTKIAITTELQRQDFKGRLLSWDTNFWGIRIAGADHPDVDQWAIDNTIGCVCLLVRADDTEKIREAEDKGYRYTDTRITLERRTHRIAEPHVRKAMPRDEHSLMSLAGRAHRITRFYADPRFDNQRCDELYEAWMRNSLDGWAHTVLTTDTELPMGYVTVHVDGEMSSIGLIAVNEKARGKGHGLALVMGALDHAAENGAGWMRVTTQGRNLSALRVFERAGFRIRETGIWMHKHRP